MEKLDRITRVVTDVDGVLTDGRIRLLPSGEEMKVFNVKDGSVMHIATSKGIEIVFLTGREGKALRMRARELGVSRVIGLSRDKGADFERLLAETGWDPEEILAVGDDITDLPFLTRAGLSAAPADAAEEVKSRVDIVTNAAGGEGVMRELLVPLLKVRGLWTL